MNQIDEAFYMHETFHIQEEEERELAIIFLQQVIRGRAIQNMVLIFF